MIISNYICEIAVLFSIFSLTLLIYSIINKNKNICKNIIIIDIIYIIYSYINLGIIPYILKIYFPLGIIVIWGLSMFSGLLFLISIVICLIKIKKLQLNIKSKKAIPVTIILLTLPIITFLFVFLREKYLINNSELILEYHSRGNGSFDGQNFAYAISDDFCEQISIGTEIDGYYMKSFLPKSSFEINLSDIQNIGYEITIDSKKILIYKNGKSIHEKKHDGNYSNIELKRIFGIKRN